MLPSDDLALASRLTARLRTAASELRDVRQLPELMMALRGSPEPLHACAYVGYKGDTPLATTGAYSHQLITQRWEIWIAVEESRSTNAEGGFYAVAGTLMADVRKALNGWLPTDAPSNIRLRRITGGEVTYAGAWGFFPMAYELTFPTSE